MIANLNKFRKKGEGAKAEQRASKNRGRFDAARQTATRRNATASAEKSLDDKPLE
jgi:hypothetical protein